MDTIAGFSTEQSLSMGFLSMSRSHLWSSKLNFVKGKERKHLLGIHSMQSCAKSAFSPIKPFILYPSSQRKLKLRKFVKICQRTTSNKQQSQDLNPGGQDSKHHSLPVTKEDTVYRVDT